MTSCRHQQMDKVKKDCFNRIPSALLRYAIFRMLKPSEAKNFFCASTAFAESTLKEFSKLVLKQVAHGQQEEVEAFLGQVKDKVLLLWLLEQENTVSDISGREFSNITPIRYAFWARDRHMWEMLLKYMPKDRAALQLQEHLKNGVQYRYFILPEHKNEVRMKGEKHFDFSPILVALKAYADNFDTSKKDRLPRQRCEDVNLEQKRLPAHVAHHYCHPSQAFHPVPPFNEAFLPRTLGCYDSDYKQWTDWYSVYSLGTRFAIGARRDGLTPAVVAAWPRWGAVVHDIESLQSLDRVRTAEFEELVHTRLGSDKAVTDRLVPGRSS